MLFLLLPLSSPQAVEVQDGIIDIRGRTDAVALSGRWAFWPNRFIYPSVSVSDFGRFEKFPDTWTNYRPEPFSSRGFASYAVCVRGLDPAVTYAIRFPSYSSAARYFVDGREIWRQGTPADTSAGERPLWKTAAVPLPVTGRTSITLVMHLSNFYDSFPAGSNGIFIGSYDSIRLARSRDRMLEIIPFGLLLSMGACFIAFYVSRRKGLPSFFLGAFAIVAALRILCYDEVIIADLVPGLAGPPAFSLGFATLPLAVAALCGFVRTHFGDAARSVLLRAVIALSLAYAIAVPFVPVGIVTGAMIPYLALCVFTSLCVIVVMVRASILGDPGASVFLAGFMVFFALAVRDMLVSMRLISGTFLWYWGAMAIVAAMAWMLVREIGGAFTSFAAVSRSLAAVNKSLSRFVPDELFGFLGKASITDICLGDNASHDLCVLFVNLGSDSRGKLELFNELLPLLSPAIQRAGGFVDSYQDEGVLLLFPDSPCRVVSCALEIARIVAESALAHGYDTGAANPFAAGIHRGKIMIGTIGESDRMEGAVISNAVGTAKHLMRYAYSRNFSLALSGEVAAVLTASGECPCALVPHGEVRLGAKGAPVDVFEARPR